MAQWTKYNNPNKRRVRKKSTYSAEYRKAREEEMYKLLAEAKDETEKQMIINAYKISINP